MYYDICSYYAYLQGSKVLNTQSSQIPAQCAAQSINWQSMARNTVSTKALNESKACVKSWHEKHY